jgi:hypothetical protein
MPAIHASCAPVITEISNMGTFNRPVNAVVPATLAVATLSLLVACGGISQTTKERVAQVETAVQQAQSAIGSSESGAVELQRAREHLGAARRAIDDGKEGQAMRHATEAQLGAELAIAKAQSAAARKAAEDMLASIETLRKEANRDDQPVAR